MHRIHARQLAIMEFHIVAPSTAKLLLATRKKRSNSTARDVLELGGWKASALGWVRHKLGQVFTLSATIVTAKDSTRQVADCKYIGQLCDAGLLVILALLP